MHLHLLAFLHDGISCPLIRCAISDSAPEAALSSTGSFRCFPVLIDAPSKQRVSASEVCVLVLFIELCSSCFALIVMLLVMSLQSVLLVYAHCVCCIALQSVQGDASSKSNCHWLFCCCAVSITTTADCSCTPYIIMGSLVGHMHAAQHAAKQHLGRPRSLHREYVALQSS